MIVRKGNQFEGASFSDCERYRFELWRIWNTQRPLCMFSMLNPSTADHLKLDPTVTRCKNFALGWGYGGLIVTNIFAYRATKPEDMRAQTDPIGPENDMIIMTNALRVIDSGGKIIAAWSQHGKMHGRGDFVRNEFKRNGIPLHYLRMGAGGMPHHPLYLPSNATPTEWV